MSGDAADGAGEAGAGGAGAEDAAGEDDVRYFFDDSLAGRPCTCEGGSQIEGTNYAGRVTYRGVLTGRGFDQGDPPWRWLELAGRSIDDHSGRGAQLVWCEQSFVFLDDEDGPGSADGGGEA